MVVVGGFGGGVGFVMRERGCRRGRGIMSKL